MAYYTLRINKIWNLTWRAILSHKIDHILANCSVGNRSFPDSRGDFWAYHDFYSWRDVKIKEKGEKLSHCEGKKDQRANITSQISWLTIPSYRDSTQPWEEEDEETWAKFGYGAECRLAPTHKWPAAFITALISGCTVGSYVPAVENRYAYIPEFWIYVTHVIIWLWHQYQSTTHNMTYSGCHLQWHWLQWHSRVTVTLLLKLTTVDLHNDTFYSVLRLST